VQSPETSRGTRRPRGASLQSVAAVRARVFSVGRRGHAVVARQQLLDNVTLPIRERTAHLFGDTTSDGQFGWGGTPLKVYQGTPMVTSDGTETRRRV
jgi:hypothetical protein